MDIKKKTVFKDKYVFVGKTEETVYITSDGNEHHTYDKAVGHQSALDERDRRTRVWNEIQRKDVDGVGLILDGTWMYISNDEQLGEIKERFGWNLRGIVNNFYGDVGVGTWVLLVVSYDGNEQNWYSKGYVLNVLQLYLDALCN